MYGAGLRDLRLSGVLAGVFVGVLVGLVTRVEGGVRRQ